VQNLLIGTLSLIEINGLSKPITSQFIHLHASRIVVGKSKWEGRKRRKREAITLKGVGATTEICWEKLILSRGRGES